MNRSPRLWPVVGVIWLLCLLYLASSFNTATLDYEKQARDRRREIGRPVLAAAGRQADRSPPCPQGAATFMTSVWETKYHQAKFDLDRIKKASAEAVSVQWLSERSRRVALPQRFGSIRHLPSPGLIPDTPDRIEMSTSASATMVLVTRAGRV